MKNWFLILFCFVFLCLTGCEKNNYFQSESSIEKKLERRWHLIQVSNSLPYEDWIFKGGNVYVINLIYNDTTDAGKYVVRTTFSDAFLSFSGFNGTSAHLNIDFTIGDINDEVLVILGYDKINGGGSIYREFEAK